MGIVDHTLNKLKPYLTDCNNMLELGCQELMLQDGIRPAKPYFESLGMRHVSIDLEECFGALKLNLTEPLDFDKQFDIVTNFGTSEHCATQYQVFKNMHDACAVGGYLFNWIPKIGNWPGHGLYTYKDSFFDFLANFFNYEIVEKGEVATCGNTKDGWTIYSILKKKSDSFVVKDYLSISSCETNFSIHYNKERK